MSFQIYFLTNYYSQFNFQTVNYAIELRIQCLNAKIVIDHLENFFHLQKLYPKYLKVINL